MRTALLLLLAAAACSADRDHASTTPTVHGPGILDKTTDGFHGKVLASVGFDLGVCAACHDDGKASGAPPCEKCHADSPAGCASCHGNPPQQGAHLAHTKAGSPDSCKTCHPVPAHWRDAGHIGAKAVIAFAAIAGPGAAFDGTRCTNVACHGAALADPAATNTQPVWTGGAAEAACGSCHGKPPANHAGGYACESCHPADAPHVDGVVEIGRTSGCDGCHGSPASPAPPIDLSGNVFSTALGVGAHQAHLVGPSRLRGPIACNACHAVPAMLTSPGHIDSGPPAEVDPSLGWDRTTATCANECHGDARPVWTKTGAAVCGSCHGIPPADSAHAPGLGLTDCVTCHSGSVDASGYPIVTNGPNGPTSEHINGHVDF